jgi:hypothetical protein
MESKRIEELLLGIQEQNRRRYELLQVLVIFAKAAELHAKKQEEHMRKQEAHWRKMEEYAKKMAEVRK